MDQWIHFSSWWMDKNRWLVSLLNFGSVLVLRFGVYWEFIMHIEQNELKMSFFLVFGFYLMILMQKDRKSKAQVIDSSVH